MDLKEIAKLIASVDGVIATKVWENHGKSRVYIELKKLNGGKNWNGGSAGTVWYEDGQIYHKNNWAGAATRDASLKTISEIEGALKSFSVEA